ncbi:hypothetical protein [uncultured Agrobacterium sp.]|uniref:hypothetical protein n=1 Tax=uncultured Agrobacterium sp. TaxID=157277 RepID=UPI002600F68C|nr:hypothetical protein [uncultured Agrobacterium sp.]
MIETIIQNTKTIIFMSSEDKAASLRFSELDGRIYVAIVDLWAQLDTRGADMDKSIYTLDDAASVFTDTGETHVIGEEGFSGCSSECKTSYLSREAATLLTRMYLPRLDSPLAKNNGRDEIGRVFEQVALSFAAK